jgi:hypothetical protein
METAFIDGQEMNQLHPTTFEVPSKEELNAITEGSTVKVGVISDMTERFWATVVSIEGDTIKATVDNDLVFTEFHGLSFGDEMTFEKKNVLAIY